MRLTGKTLAMLGQRECQLWPECGCYHILERWGKLLSNDETEWKLIELEAGETVIFATLCCVVAHCPDTEVREYMRQQLKHPFWQRQKSMGGWTSNLD